MKRNWNTTLSRLRPQRMPILSDRRSASCVIQGAQPYLCLAAATNGEQPATFAWLAPWTARTFAELVHHKDVLLPAEQKVDEIDEDFINRIKHLAFNLLLFLSQAPIEYMPTTVLRKARQEGKHLRPSLCRARFVGSCQIRPLRPHIDYAPTGRHVAAHWKAGSWRKVPCGPHRSERKLTWVEPYPVGELRDELLYDQVPN